MAFDLAKHAKETREGKVEFPDGSVLNFTFFSHYYTPKFEKAAKAVDTEKDGSGPALKAWLLPLLASWDVVTTTWVDKATGKQVDCDDPTRQGELEQRELPVPITDEGFDNIPTKVLGMVLSAITAAMSPGEETDTVSSSSSASAT